MLHQARWMIALGCVLAGAGCGLRPVETALPVFLEDVNRIRDDDNLSAQEKRDRLAELGLDPLAINAILAEERQGNQFGGTLRTALDKVRGGRLTQLTPDEVQIYNDEANDVDTTITADFDDGQAQAIVEFFNRNGLNTRDQLRTFLEPDENDLPRGVEEDDLRDVFVTFDPDRLFSEIP